METGSIMTADLPRAEAIFAATFNCTPSVAAVVATHGRAKAYPARSTIIENGSPNDSIFVNLSGHARKEALSLNGRLVVLEDYFTGDIFGEGGLNGVVSLSDEVTAVEPVEASAFSSASFISLMTNYNSIALAFSHILLTRLSRATQRLMEGATLSANGRIYAELLRQARAGNAMAIEPTPVLSSFALAVQSTRETVSRAINGLEKRGIIRRDEHRLIVVAPHRLEELIF